MGEGAAPAVSVQVPQRELQKPSFVAYKGDSSFKKMLFNLASPSE